MLGLTAGLISLIIFGNIENLILASQGVVKGANPVKLGILSVIIVICWLLIGTFGTQLYIHFRSPIHDGCFKRRIIKLDKMIK